MTWDKVSAGDVYDDLRAAVETIMEPPNTAPAVSSRDYARGIAYLRDVRSELAPCCGRRPTVGVSQSAEYGFWFWRDQCGEWGEEPRIWNTLKGPGR